MFSIGGIASGLDTETMIRQLMQLERIPVRQFQQRQQQLRGVDDAWGKVVGKLSALRSAVDKVNETRDFASFTAVTSSNADAVAATKTGSPSQGSLTFTVSQLAQRHQVAYAEMASPDALVGAGTFTVNGKSITTTADTTLAQLAKQVNDAGAGVNAQVVQTSGGAYRLMLSAKASGTANAISVTATPPNLGAQTELRAAADAVLDLGGGVTVTRSSNTITNLIEGVTLDLKQAGATTTVSTARDTAAAAEAIKEMVKGLNDALTTLKDLTAYDPTSKKSGALQGDSTARRLTIDLRSAISSAVAGLTGDFTSAGQVGISLTRDGMVKLDEAKLSQALSTNFDAVTDLFSRAGQASHADVTYVRSTDRTANGDHTVRVTSAATVAAVTGATYSPPLSGEPKVFRIVNDKGVEVSVTLDSTDTDVTAAVNRINNALSAAGVSTITASDDGGAIRLAEDRYGDAPKFTVISDTAGDNIYGLAGEHRGTDIQGEFVAADGTVSAATGTGRTLTATAGPATGLVVRADVAAAGDYGTVTVTGGLGGALGGVLSWAEGSDGAVTRARSSLTDHIRRIDDRIAEFEVRLTSRETTLRRQFTALETAMSKLQSQSSWMSMQLASFNAPQG